MAQLYSGGIVTATGFKINAPQLIDDRCAVDLDSDLDNIPNKCKGLHAYSDEDGGSLHYYNGTEWIKISNSGEFKELTKSQLDTAIGNGELVTGAVYKITGVNPELYGGTDIYLTAISPTELNPKGVGKFYNPQYDQNVAGFGIAFDYKWWAAEGERKPAEEYTIGDEVIWGGKLWVCTQSTTTSTWYIEDEFNLDTDYFDVVSFNDTDYNIVFDAIYYDYANDWIIERSEKNSNIVSYSYDWLVYFSSDILGEDIEIGNPIINFQWGNLFDYDNYKGIGFQRITNSLNKNINFRGAYQTNLTFYNSSAQYNLTFDNDSYQTDLTFDSSSQTNLTFDNNSYQYYLTFGNNSFQYNLTFDSSSQYSLTFDNSSSQSYLTFDNSLQSNLTFYNSSSQSYLTFDNSSYQTNLTFYNSSAQYNLTFDNDSYQTDLTFDSSSQTNLTFDNDSYQTDLTFDNGSSQTNLTAITSNKSQQNINFKSYQIDRTGVPLTDDETNLTYDNTAQGLKLTGAEVFTPTDDEDYVQKKYVDDNYILESEKGANNGVATLDGGGKIPATQLPNSVMTLEGEWKADTNTPTLADGTGNAGMVYEVTAAGTQNLGSGSITFAVGDYVVYNGVKWGRIDGVNGFIELSKSQLDTAIAGGDLVAGALYKITGVNPELYGGTDVYLTAISSTELNPNGVGKFYNPKYDKEVVGFGIVKDYVWWADLENQKESGEYDVDDVVIWGGKHWVCTQETTTATKYIIDDFELDTDYFEVVPFNDADYNIAYDGVKYDYENDWIIERNEKGSNVVSFSYDWLVYFTDGFWGGSVDYNHPIRGFMWGNIYDDYKGIGFQTITNSLNKNINFSGSYQSNLTFNNSLQDYLTFDNSYQDYLTFDNGSYQYNLTFDNGSYQDYLTFDNNSYQSNLTFDNGSYQSSITFNSGSSQNNLTFDNNSYQNLIGFNSGQQSNLTFDNGSYQSSITFNSGSSQNNLTFDNNSYQYFLTFDNYSSQNNLTSSGSNRKQEFLTFNSYQSYRTGQPLDSNETNLAFNNTSQGLKLKGAEVFSITDDEDYVQKKYVDDNYILKSEKGANNGVATLDSGGKVPSTQLPDYLPLSGGTLTGNLTISKSSIDSNDRLLLINDLNTGNGRRPFELRSAAASSALRFNTTTATWDWFIGSVGQMRFDRAGQIGVVEIRNDAIASSIYADATGVGIGLASPTQSLDVVGNARFRSVGTGTFDKLLGVTSTGVLTTNVPTYLTANQTITLSGDVTGSGTTAISGTIANDAVTNAKLNNMAEGTIKGRVASGTGDPQDLTFDAVIKAMGLAIPVIYDLEDFTLPAMSSPPAQNSFSPITILSSTEIPANMIDWEITWTDSGIHYKLSSIGDYNIELRESGGDIQISGQTRSQSSIAVDDTTNEPKIIFYVKPE